MRRRNGFSAGICSACILGEICQFGKSGGEFGESAREISLIRRKIMLSNVLGVNEWKMYAGRNRIYGKKNLEFANRLFFMVENICGYYW